MGISWRHSTAGVIGNVLEHYDHALFGLLAPFIAPLFFEESDPLTALILTYGMLPLGLLTRPLGSLCFGLIGDRLGRRQALFYSLIGMALVTFGMGCLPTYREIGIWAPLFLAFGKMLQNFFVAGESTGGAIFVLEHADLKKRSLISSFYDASSIIGILIASGLVTLLSLQGMVEEKWRVLFWMGGATGILGVVLRMQAQDKMETFLKLQKIKVIQVVKEHKKALACIILASGFSYTTYSMAFTLMNGFVPLVTALTKADVMKINTLLLILDMLLLPFFGFLAHRIGKERIMYAAAFSTAIVALPLFYFLDRSSFFTVIIVRSAIMVLGVAFAAPYHAWALERVPPYARYTILSLGSALGSQLIGVPTSSICLWLYQKFHLVSAPGFYLVLIASAAGFVLHFAKVEEEKLETIK